MSRTVFQNVRILIGDGSPVIENAVLAFGEGGCIEYAAAADAFPGLLPGDRAVDMQGRTVMPGLFNVHVHLWFSGKYYGFSCDPYGTPMRTMIYDRHLKESLLCGVTTVRSVGGSDDIDVALRNAVNSGMTWGSRLITCAQPIKPHGGHCHLTRGSVFASGPDEFRKAVRIEASKGADQIKLMMTGGAGGTSAEGMFDIHMTEEEIRAACDTAHMLGKIVCAHLSNDNAIRTAVENGVDCVEHAYTLSDETAELMAQRGCYLVPTLAVTNCMDMQKTMQKLYGYPQLVMDRLYNARAEHVRSCKRAIDHGIPICTGTDTLASDRIGGTWATTWEVELLVDAGMTPLEAIAAGTWNCAKLCGIDNKVGALREGMLADLLIIDGKPDKDIKDLRKLMLVAKEGNICFSRVPGFEKAMPLPYRSDEDILGQLRAW